MKPTPESPILDTLGKATFGLLFSERVRRSAHPYRYPGKGGEEPTAASLLEAEGLPSTTPVETITLDDLFDPFVEADPSASAEDRAEAERYRDLVDLLSSELTDVRVYRVGETDIDVYVLGKDPCGDWVGLKTHVVET